MKGCKDMTPRVDTLHAMDARRLAEEKRRESHPPSTTRPQPEQLWERHRTPTGVAAS